MKLYEVTRLKRCQGFDLLYHSMSLSMVVLKRRIGRAGAAAASCMLQCKSRRCQMPCCQSMVCNESLAARTQDILCLDVTEHHKVNK